MNVQQGHTCSHVRKNVDVVSQALASFATFRGSRMRERIEIRSMFLSFVMLTLPVVCHAAGKRAQGENEWMPNLVARMSLPWNNSLVRGNVPVFGVAYGRDFKLWRLEFGEGEEPKRWQTIKVSHKQVTHDPWTAGEVRWDPDWGARGNLYTWETGLTSYEYRSYPWTKNLNGIYTLRLVVEGKSGQTVEARVTVEVGRVLVRAKGGTANSPDNRVVLSAPPQAITEDFLTVSIQPSTDVSVGPDYVQIGKIYEFRPPRTNFTKPVTFTMSYSDDMLHANGKTIPEKKLGIYAYQPVEQYWKYVPCKLIAEQNTLVAKITSVTRYVAYFCILADLKAPETPALAPLPKSVEANEIDLNGTAEPGCKVEVFVGENLVATARADDAGRFTADHVALRKGSNTLRARAVDAAGNASPYCPPILVRYMPHPPKRVKSVQILGTYYAMQEDRFLVKLVGEDSNPNVNTCMAHVFSSATDPKGIDLLLRETEPTSGIYVGLFQVKRQSNQERSQIGALRDGEIITAFSLADPSKRDTQPYKDMTPPTAPRIWSPTHPSHCQWTFENTGSGRLGEWRTLDGKYGAAVTRIEDYQNCYLELSKQARKSHLGAVAIEKPFPLDKFPILAFDYCFDPWVRIDLLVNLKGIGWRNVNLTDERTHYYERIGKVFGIVRDGRWQHAEVDLLGLARRAYPGRAEYVAEGIQFVNWDKTGALRMSFGASGLRPISYQIDNFALLAYSSKSDVEFRWEAQDEDGIAGYSFCLDHSRKMMPKKTLMTTDTQKRYEGLDDGRWYFHVRAQDKPGNWGPANHYLVVIDTAAPKVVAASPRGENVPWDTPITVRFDDSNGTGINPYSVRLVVDELPFSIVNDGLSFDVETQTLTFRPRDVSPAGMLYADGQTVRVHLRAADYMGRQVTGQTDWVYQVTSPLKVRPSRPDGKNGWYITPPEIRYETHKGEEVKYDWQIDFAQDEFARRGNSINTLIVNLKRQGKTERFAKLFKLDTTIPRVSVRIAPPIPDGHNGMYLKPPTVSLSHDDYVLRAGGLTGTYFAGEFEHPILTRQDAADVFAGPLAAKHTVVGAHSARWRGKIHADVSGDYEISLASPSRGASAGLLIDGTRLLTAAGPQRRQSAARVFLFAGFHDIEIRYRSQKSANWRMSLRWKPPKQRRTYVPSDQLFAIVPLAKIYYRWDDGPVHVYKVPFPARRGKHVLYAWAEDEAGHIGEKTSVKVAVMP